MIDFNTYNKTVNLSAIKEYCLNEGHMALYSKEDTFVQQGEIGKYLGVVESGYFKYTILNSSDDESVVGFAFEGEIVADFYNSFHNIPSEVNIISGAKSYVSQISTKKAKSVFNTLFDNNLSSITGALFNTIYSRYLELHRTTPMERYLNLISNYPQIFNIVPLKDIASYLLITPTYLSRIRKNICK